MTDLLRRAVSGFQKSTVLVIGDCMLDRYLYGDISEVSEGAYPRFVEKSREHFRGGAANVAMNIATLGGRALLLGAVGRDEEAEFLDSCLPFTECHDVLQWTTVKTRFCDENGRPIFRMDRDAPPPENPGVFVEAARRLIQSHAPDIVVISDYGKGVVTAELLSAVLKSGPRVIVDPKPAHASYYHGAFLIKPNYAEAVAMNQSAAGSDAETVAKGLAHRFGGNIVLSLGPRGAIAVEIPGETITRHHNEPATEPNVIGAGDALVAGIALGLAAGLSLSGAAELGNVVAGIKVRKRATEPVSAKELVLELLRRVETAA